MTAEFAYAIGMIAFVLVLLFAGWGVYKVTKRP